MGKRDSIVAAAINVIREDGLAGFTQPRVARRAGLRQSHLTYYFPTREDLLVAVTEQAVADRISVLGSVTEAGSPSEKVRCLAQVLTDPEQTRVLLALIQSADRHEAVRAAFDQLRAGVGPGSADLIRAWGAEPTSDAQQLLQAASTGLAVLALANNGAEFQSRVEQLVSTLLTGLTIPAADEEDA